MTVFRYLFVRLYFINIMNTLVQYYYKLALTSILLGRVEHSNVALAAAILQAIRSEIFEA